MNKQTIFIILGVAAVGTAAYFIFRPKKKVIEEGTFHITINN